MLKDIINQLDKMAWQVDNQSWLAARELEWLEVEPKLLKGLEYKKKDVDKLKKYFMYGENLAELGLSFHPLIEVLYLHPDQSDENLKNIIDSFDENDYLAFKSSFYMYSDNTGSIRELYPVRVFSEKPFGEEGILNGKEQFYVQYFTPDLTVDGKTEVELKKIKKKAQSFFDGFCTNMYNFLLSESEYRADKYSFSQFQIETWLQAAPMADYGKKRAIILNGFLHQLYYWRELNPAIENQPERLAFVTKMTEILGCDKDLPEPLLKRWQMIKTEQGRYHPIVVEEFINERPPELWQKFNLKGI
ncbi:MULTISPECIES: hypothetical protein [unclassified Pseudoalteromonas]|uniref:hypothetical protein n=1 Tax=unclassified Pseudoalteromonas TaxID=194690 RepID=UPI0005A66BEF|nr:MULTISPECIES: hypothetical protein [unclassified Pseudoalteromonas]